ncbi:hypothetical protein ECDEC6B_5592 [Escherichia coli DEC6B]|nr:hypothetical protein ECDEC6B_5592 [Escherichia coli DEC6B]
MLFAFLLIKEWQESKYEMITFIRSLWDDGLSGRLLFL